MVFCPCDAHKMAPVRERLVTYPRITGTDSLALGEQGW